MRYYLVGFMGSGKSHWANVWAANNGLNFIDLDKCIEEKENLSVLDIFDLKGEAYFRVVEAEALRETTKYENCVISCGGGTPCFSENMKWMNKNGFTIYLSANPPLLLSYIMNDTAKRPLVKNVNENELLYFVQQTLSARVNYYEEAKMTLDVPGLTEQSFGIVLKSAHV